MEAREALGICAFNGHCFADEMIESILTDMDNIFDQWGNLFVGKGTRAQKPKNLLWEDECARLKKQWKIAFRSYKAFRIRDEYCSGELESANRAWKLYRARCRALKRTEEAKQASRFGRLKKSDPKNYWD